MITKEFTYNRSFAEAPTPENDALWESIFPPHGGFFHDKTVTKYGASLAAYHQLHCLVSLPYFSQKHILTTLIEWHTSRVLGTSQCCCFRKECHFWRASRVQPAMAYSALHWLPATNVDVQCRRYYWTYNTGAGGNKGIRCPTSM